MATTIFLSALESALSRFGAADDRGGLEALIEAWRCKRGRRLLRLVQAAGRRVSWTGEPVGASGSRAADAEWIAQARRHDVAALPMLLQTLRHAVAARADDRLAAISDWDDPRISEGLLSILDDPPWRSRPALSFWRRSLRLIEQIGHPDAIERLEQLASRYPAMIATGVGLSIQGYIHAHLKRLRAAAPTEPTLEGAEVQRCEQLEAALSADLQADRSTDAALRRAKRTEDDFLAAIYEQPRSDEPRAVFSDWLMERGDPRGELIALQLATEATDDLCDREVRLVQQLDDRCTGPLAPAAEAPLFHRGFVSWVHHLRVRKALARLANDPAWATVETIAYSSYTWKELASALLKVVCAENMRGLTGLKNVPGESLAVLAERGVLQQIERLDVNVAEPAGVAAAVAWLGAARDPRYLLLHRGSLYRHDPQRLEPDSIAAILQAPGISRLKVLAVESGAPAAPWLAALAGVAGLERLSFSEPYGQLRGYQLRKLFLHLLRGSGGGLDHAVAVDEQPRRGMDRNPLQPFDAAEVARLLDGAGCARLWLDARRVRFPAAGQQLLRAAPTAADLQALGRFSAAPPTVLTGIVHPARELSIDL